MPAYLSPVFNEPQSDANGNPMSGGRLFTYLAGSTTPATTYTSSAGTVPQQNPIILNSRGVPDNPIWLGAGVAYKFVLQDANLVTQAPTIDNVQGINDPAAVSSTQSEWVTLSATPTFLSATSFSVPGDQTQLLQVSRRLQTANSGGVVYSTISTSVFAAGVTTVTVSNDTSTLDAGLSAVSYGLLAPLRDSVPRNIGTLRAVQRIAATAVYTPTPGTTSVIVELIGGGGGGGGCAATGAGQIAAGGGGGGGGYAKSRLTSGFSGVTVTIGAAGTASAGAGGGAGGTTSFGAVFSATGGAGGNLGAAAAPGTITVSVGGTGGSGTGNIITIIGAQGAPGIYFSSFGNGGQGGSGAFGAGGSGIYSPGVGSASPSIGGGGGGSALGASSAANAGGAGGQGLCIIWEYA